MTNDQLKALDDNQLRAVIDQAGTLLKEREADRKQKAIEEAKAKLAAVGLTFRDVVKTKTDKGKARAPLPPGQSYVNPSDSSQTYTTGRGRPPKWFAELQAKGNLPQPSKKAAQPKV